MSLPISGFTAVPNPQMLAFMAAQSFVMMFQAGEGWQYGKRRQSAMSNEEFNKQTPNSIMERQLTELKTALPTIERSMDAMTPMIRTIVNQYGDFIAEIIKSLPTILENAQGGQSLTGNISTVGKELRDIIANLIPKLPTASATLVTNNPNYTSSSPPSADAYAHTLGTHAGHTVGNITTTQGPIEGPPAPPIPATIASPRDQPSISTKLQNQNAEWNAWSQKKTNLFNLIAVSKANVTKWTKQANFSNNQSDINRKNRFISALRSQRSILRQMSNDYRNPNPLIQKGVLALRQLIARGVL